MPRGGWVKPDTERRGHWACVRPGQSGVAPSSQESRVEVGVVLLWYGRLDVSEVRGSALADLLVAVDADLRVVDGDQVVYEEPAFPVAELAWSLARWVGQPSRGDFVFDSMSFEELGALTIRWEGAGWKFGSVFVPDVTSRVVSWNEVRNCVAVFVWKVRDDLAAAGLDAASVR